MCIAKNHGDDGFVWMQVMNGRKFTAVPILVGNTTMKADQEYGKCVTSRSDLLASLAAASPCHVSYRTP